MLQKIKDWLILILLAIVGLLGALLLSRRPKWIKEKEKEIEGRKKNINQSKINIKKKKSEYAEMMQNHDEKINAAKQGEKEPNINNPDDAANYLDDILSNNGE